MLNKSLDLLSQSKSFRVDKKAGCYEVRPVEKSNLVAVIHQNGFGDGIVDYAVEGLLKSNVDCIEINMEQLNELKTFCELMVGEVPKDRVETYKKSIKLRKSLAVIKEEEEQNG